MYNGVLAQLPMLQGADAAALERAAHHTRCRICEPDATIIDFDDPTDSVFFIVEGMVRVRAHTGAGYEMILSDLGPGDTFGELAVLGGQSRSANVTTLHRSRFYVLPGKVFLDLILTSPSISQRLLQHLASLVRLNGDRLFEMAALPVRQRLLAELLRLSRKRGKSERVVSPPPPHHVLAARIGARREAVSRQLSELERVGLIHANRRAIVLHQPELLRIKVDNALRGITEVIPAQGR